MDSNIAKLENVIDPESMNRGLKGSWSRGMLKKTAQMLLDTNRLLIVTGFCIPEKGIGETDGPSGALAIGYALKKLGKEVWIGTDRFSINIMKAAAMKVDMEDRIYDVAEVVPVNQEQSEWLKYMDAVVFIERPGKAKNGRNYNMSGEEITAYTVDTEVLFNRAQEYGIPVVAVGDGGNEAGMGCLCEAIESNVPHGRKICAVTKADYLILSGVSNWGGYALAATLELLSQRPCVYPPEMEEQIIKTMVDHGAVDGVTKKPAYSVDGVQLPMYLNTIREIYKVTKP